MADLAFENDVEALIELRRFVDFLPASNRAGRRRGATHDPRDRVEPSLDTLVPSSPNKPYDMKELIEKVVDEGDFFEIQPNYARNILIGFARMEGSTVGSVANQPMVLAGCLDIDSSPEKRRASFGFAIASNPDRHLRRCTRLPSRHRPGIRRDHQAWCEAALSPSPKQPCRR